MRMRAFIYLLKTIFAQVHPKSNNSDCCLILLCSAPGHTTFYERYLAFSKSKCLGSFVTRDAELEHGKNQSLV